MKTDSDRPRSYLPVIGILAMLVVSLLPGEVQAQTLYTVQGSGGSSLRTVDPNTAATLSTVPITVPGQTIQTSTGLATHPITQVLYAVVKFNSVGTRSLITINPGTGAGTIIGTLGGENFAAIAFDCNGTLYGVTGESSPTPESLFRIDTATAAPTFVLGLGAGSDGEALAFNPTDGFLYHASGHSGTCGGGGVCFERIDINTLNITNIDISGGDLIDEEAQALAWSESLGAFLWKQNHGTGPLFRVAADGTETLVGGMDHQAKGLAFVPTFTCGNVSFPIVRHSGNAQTGLVSTQLPLPLVVRIQTPGGQPVSGTTVNFSVISGGGSVSSTSATSNAVGLAQTLVTLGPDPGANIFSASIMTFAGLRAVNFAATSVLNLNPPPVTPIIQITLGGIVNGATFILGPGLAPGSIAALFGTNLAASSYALGRSGNTADATQSAAADGDAPTLLEGTQVFVNSVPAPLFFVSPTQINFQIPPSVPVGNAQVQVVWPGSFLPIVSGVATVAIVPHGPGVFSNPAGSTGQGAVLNSNSSANSASNPAARGSVIQIFATGLGATNPPVAAGVRAPGLPLSLTATTPQVTIGGRAAEVRFSGFAPGFVGLYQVNAVVPQDVTPGSAVSLQVTIGGQTSRAVTVAVQ